MRSLRAAFNDFARTNVTAEVEALHADVNRVQAENAQASGAPGDRGTLLEQLQKERS